MARFRRDRLSDGFEEIVVKVNRCCKVVKGGKRFSFSALVCVGNRKGQIGWGYGKAKEVPFAVDKGIQEAKKNLITVPIVKGTIPHRTMQKHSATTVLLMPACAGTGVKAGSSARSVIELAGVHNVLTKVQGSTNPINVVKATIKCLENLKTIKTVEETRGVALRKRDTIKQAVTAEESK